MECHSCSKHNYLNSRSLRAIKILYAYGISLVLSCGHCAQSVRSLVSRLSLLKGPGRAWEQGYIECTCIVVYCLICKKAILYGHHTYIPLTSLVPRLGTRLTIDQVFLHGLGPLQICNCHNNAQCQQVALRGLYIPSLISILFFFLSAVKKFWE